MNFNYKKIIKNGNLGQNFLFFFSKEFTQGKQFDCKLIRYRYNLGTVGKMGECVVLPILLILSIIEHSVLNVAVKWHNFR